MTLAYASLFLAAFGAATILPMQSEAVLTGLLLTKNYPVWLLVTIASIGNTLGSAVNWGLGIGIEKFRDRKWFPVKQKLLDNAQNWYRRYGRWSLLLSWVPFIGDPLTLAAGVMREKFLPFIAIVGFAKTSRYVAIALIAG